MRIKRVRVPVRWVHGAGTGMCTAVRSDGRLLVRWNIGGYMQGHETWMRREELVVAKARAKARVRAVAA